MIPRNMKSRDMVGMEVKTAREIKNRAGTVVPKGKRVKIASFGREFTIRTEKCPHCGLSACMSGVTRNDVELISENDRKEQKKTKWIPCVDHFPEDKRTVLVCGDTGWIRTGWREKGYWWTGFSLADIKDDVVAWQPLPEPYHP